MNVEVPEDGLLQAIRQKHLASWTWRKDAMPTLAIWVNAPAHREGLTYDRLLDHQAIFEYQSAVLADTMSIGSDVLPVLPINHFGVALQSSMFGAELTIPDVEVTALQNVGPWVKPIFLTAEAMADAQVPPISSGLMPHVIKAVEYYRDNAPDGVTVVTPFRLGPFTLAELLRGPKFYEDLCDHPEQAHHLLSVCADTVIAVEKFLRGLLGQSHSESITNFGIYLPGVRVNDDSLMNLSPSMIREFAVPYFRRIAREFGRTLVHYCSTPSNTGEHVLHALLDEECVLGVCTQLGISFHREMRGCLEGSLALGSGYGDSIQWCCGEHGGLEGWAGSLVDSAEPTAGLVLHTEVESLEDARRMWDVWCRAFD